MIETTVWHTARFLVRLIKSISPTAPSAFLEVQQLHSCTLKFGLVFSDFISSALISSYSAIGYTDVARKLFNDIPQPGVVPWTSIVRAYVTINKPVEAVDLFQTMLRSGLSPDPISLATVISACHQFSNLSVVKIIHGYIICSGVEVDPFVTTELMKVYGDRRELVYAQQLFDEMPVRTVVASNAMMHQYVKHGSIEMAAKLFMEMPIDDVVSWNTLISGYYQAGKYLEALSMFGEMLLHKKPNAPTFCAILSACAGTGALDTGMWLHAHLDRTGINLNGDLDHCLIDMYSKCGNVKKALQVFRKVPVRRDLYSWTTAICGLAMHGQATHALCLFFQMLQVGIKPDNVTLVGVLSACAHRGLVNQGCRFFNLMEETYGLIPQIEHYGCLIDLLSRVGQLKEAYDIVLGMPMKPNAAIWGALMSACKVYNNLELGEIAAKKLIELEPWDPWARVMLSNMYADANDWSGVMGQRKEMKGVSSKKAPGCSSIEVNGEMHEFLAGGSLHPQIEDIFAVLEEIEVHMHRQPW